MHIKVKCAEENYAKIEQEVSDLLAKGAIPGVYRKLRLPTISGGEARGSKSNKSQQPQLLHKAENFKMEGLHLLPNLIQPQDWMVKFNLKILPSGPNSSRQPMSHPISVGAWKHISLYAPPPPPLLIWHQHPEDNELKLVMTVGYRSWMTI